tara:strand:+ start:936 stop:1238 length:303 start_codon:yes stop_codon:yes gene_type:complete
MKARKQIIKVLNSLGLTMSKTKTKLKEVSFDNFQKRTTVFKSGYNIYKDCIYLIFEDYTSGDWNDIKKSELDFTKKVTNKLKQNNFNVEQLDGENIILIK